MLHEYEIIVIVRPDLDDATTSATIEKIEELLTADSGHILGKDDWGKRRLAYAIKKHLKGHYVLFNTLLKPSAIDDFERKSSYDDRIMRILTVKLADAVDVEARLEEAAEIKAGEEAAAAAAAAAAETAEAEASTAEADAQA